MTFSIIIPTYNEAEHIDSCVALLIQNPNVEVIVADSPASTDNMKNIALGLGCVYLKTKKAGRNHQMNEAVALSKGEILYFVHADTIVPKEFATDIRKAISKGADMGCYRYKFDEYKNPLLYINSFFTRFPMLWCRGGDQTLFIKRGVFNALGGYCEKHVIMEDYEFLQRCKGKYKFEIIPKNVIVSARKYAKNGYFRVQMANLIVMRKWLGKKASSEELREFYGRMLN